MKFVFLALLLLGCATVASSSGEQYQSITAFGQFEVIPTPMHHALWAMMQECTNQERDFEGIRWFVADSLVTDTGDKVWGVWTPERKIVLASGLWYLPGLIAHEVMHDLYDGPIPAGVEVMCTPQVSAVMLREILR